VIEIDQSRSECVAPLLSGLRYYDPIAWSVVEGKQSGSILVNRDGDPDYALIRGANRYFYLASSCTALPDEAVAVLDVRRPGFTICVEPIEWAIPLQQAIGNKAQILKVLSHRLSGDQRWSGAGGVAVPANCALRKIDSEFFDRIAADFTQVMAVLWMKKEEFLTNGIGYCLLESDRIASICFTGFIGGGACDITVMTDPAFRQRGYARLVSAALVEEACRRKLSPQWHTTTDNAASLAIAAALGFRCIGEYPIVEVSRG